jgi:hypothetical protein
MKRPVPIRGLRTDSVLNHGRGEVVLAVELKPRGSAVLGYLAMSPAQTRELVEHLERALEGLVIEQEIARGELDLYLPQLATLFALGRRKGARS